MGRNGEQGWGIARGNRPGSRGRRSLRIRLPGYARVSGPGARGLALESCKGALERILEKESVYEFAARQDGARRLEGRAPVYAVELPEECGTAVIRRSMRGGALARFNTDLFFPPTRGLRELITSLQLRTAGVSTPEIIAYVVYRAGVILRRTDVVTRELTGGVDLASLLAADDRGDRKSTRLNSSHGYISYAVFCLKKKMILH